MIKPLVYTPARKTRIELPFDRFLPLDPPGMAARWLKRNPDLKDEALDAALLDEPWDPAGASDDWQSWVNTGRGRG